MSENKWVSNFVLLYSILFSFLIKTLFCHAAFISSYKEVSQKIKIKLFLVRLGFGPSLTEFSVALLNINNLGLDLGLLTACCYIND